MDTRLCEIVEKKNSRDFDGMLRVFRDLDDDKCILPPRFAVLKARAIQVAGDSSGYMLPDVECCLLEVIDADDSYLDAYIELAYYYYAVADDSEKALVFFDRAASLSRGCLRDAVIGRARSLADLGRLQDALACLDERVFDNSELDLLKRELNDLWGDSPNH